VIRYAKLHGTEHRPWLTALLARWPTKVAAIELALFDQHHDGDAGDSLVIEAIQKIASGCNGIFLA
jgi:hypothetical protein